MPSTPTHRLAGLDTLRACAIVWVMLYHLGGALPAVLEPVGGMGWLGVDLFFVLSGYLIGSQLLRNPTNISEFYRRRAYRILPAYLAVVVLYLWVPQWREASALPSAWKLLTFTANLWMNYPAERAFSHVWSLCIEEHFYLVLPFALALLRRRRAVTIVLLFAAFFAAGIALRWWILHSVIALLPADDRWIPMMKYIYYPTYSRLDGLLSGLALVTVRTFRAQWWNRISAHGNGLLLGGLALSTAGMAVFHFDYPSTDVPPGLLVGFPLVSLGFALCVAAATCSSGLLTNRVPGAKVLATLAFSLYLTHKAVAHVDTHLMPWMQDNRSWLAAYVYAATCIAVAGALYLLVERPFLVLRDRRMTGAKANLEARINPAL